MSKPIAQPPIPRQPIGTTFVVAISLLGALAIIQLFAVAWHYIPLVRQQVGATAERQEAPQQVAPDALPTNAAAAGPFRGTAKGAKVAC